MHKAICTSCIGALSTTSLTVWKVSVSRAWVHLLTIVGFEDGPVMNRTLVLSSTQFYIHNYQSHTL